MTWGQNWRAPGNVIVNYLVSAGVPVNRPDHRGIYPFQAVAGSLDSTQPSMIQTLHMICPDDGLLALDIQRFYHSATTRFSACFLKTHSEVIRQSSKLAEMYNGHPSEAIVLHNESALSHALHQNASLSELAASDVLGITSLYHLLAWPQGLRLVLERFGTDAFNAPGEPLRLEDALSWGSHICTGKWLAGCQDDCSCTDVVKLIMDTDTECLAKATSRETFMGSVIRASPKARELLAKRLGSLRQELKALSLVFLSPQEIEKWDLRCTKILDQHTHDVLAALTRRGQIVPLRLSTDVSYSDDTSWSIFHSLASFYVWGVAEAADAFYRHGYHEIDLPDTRGYTPIMLSGNLHYVAWLIRHGAKLRTREPGDVEDRVVAPRLSRCLAREIDFKNSKLTITESFTTICKALYDDWFNDACVCGCSSRGCNPFTPMWIELFRLEFGVVAKHMYTWQECLEQATTIICQITAKVETIGTDSKDFKLACLRASTFEMLPVRHTCCSPERGKTCDDEERREIREEDAFELNRLEILVEEFEGEFSKLSCSLTKFIQTYWSERMGTVLREIADQKLNKEEIDNIEMLGVSLQIEDETGEQHEVQGDPTQMEYWYRRLDALV
ncbi:hypothetical protein CKAH01_16483 [Colletotrichum kahawae]|uniref:Ankyrin repeat protein n=1 Tax=Colletotrichum kahawae TaxID=34407 RepID=A0AAE0D6Q7_COLKA|nr:hypothetical protein CKAH01_16483 [Colletotrichum kahawae]